ncbi:hypothetical protein [Yersinia enterocolitica]|uniref:hypothetical protein n=1 Tax=Yersinia enterocolitica TaxID=630 RepID=UPI0005E5DF25|nr:hypothetical protein [Yersinia enterocolitica]CNK47993.1 Uncharacterised protein [Yersinia enterocolitica]
MNISSTAVGRVFAQAINSMKSKQVEFSTKFNKLAHNLTYIKNSNENLNILKEWKRDLVPLGITSLHIKHPHQYMNSSTDRQPESSSQSAKLTNAYALNPDYIGKPMTTDNTPAFFKNIHNPDAF